MCGKLEYDSVRKGRGERKIIIHNQMCTRVNRSPIRKTCNKPIYKYYAM